MLMSTRIKQPQMTATPAVIPEEAVASAGVLPPEGTPPV